MTDYRARARKAAETRLRNDPDAFRSMGSKGGAASSSRPFKDSEVARRAGKKSARIRRKRQKEV